VLQFELDNSLGKTRDTIRVSIMDLIRVTSHITTENVFVQVNIQSNEGAEEDKSLDIPLKIIRQQALRCLSDILATHPEYYARPCPELWINGFGTIVEMTLGSIKTPVSLQPSTPTLHSNPNECLHTEAQAMRRRPRAKLATPRYGNTTTPHTQGQRFPVPRWHAAEPHGLSKECD
jgi:hypothetical protein